MKTHVVPIRLTDEELAWLDRFVAGKAGYSNRSEYLRALLHREHAKRARTGPISRSSVDTAFRTGRPSTKNVVQ